MEEPNTPDPPAPMPPPDPKGWSSLDRRTSTKRKDVQPRHSNGILRSTESRRGTKESAPSSSLPEFPGIKVATSEFHGGSMISRIGGALFNGAASAASAAVGVASSGVSLISPLISSHGDRVPPSDRSRQPRSRATSSERRSPEGDIIGRRLFEDFPKTSSGGRRESLNFGIGKSGIPAPIPLPPPSGDVRLRTRRYRQTTVFKEGILDKWTNYLGAWRARYFILEPGILKYANAPGELIKETFPLVLCTTRHSPTDPLRIEIEHPQGILYLRMPNAAERREWIDALLKAKNVFQQPPSSAPILRPPLYQKSLIEQISKNDNSAAPAPSELKDALTGDDFVKKFLARTESESGDEKSPMVCLIENCVSCRQSMQSGLGGVQTLQSRFLQLAGRARDPQYCEDAKALGVQLVERLDLLQVIMARHLLGSEALALEERSQRRALEKSLRAVAKRNYRMKMRLRRLRRLLIDEDAGAAPKPSEEPVESDATTTDKGEKTGGQTGTALLFAGPAKQAKRKQQRLAVLLSENFSEEEDSVSSRSSQTPTSGRGEDEEDEFFDADELTTMKEEGESLQIEPINKEEQIERRSELPMPRSDFKVSLWSILKDTIGKDLSRVSFPVYFNEPTSFLQRLAEDFQYTHLLKQAATLDDPVERMLRVAVFTVTPCASTVERTYKPFNPLLGETYEFSHKGFKFIAEQVGHHPPVTAYHLHAPGVEAWGCLAVKTRFTGRSVEITVPGIAHVKLTQPDKAQEPYEDHFTYSRQKAVVTNVIFGKLSLEMTGAILVSSHSHGTCAVVEYLRQGWWGREKHCIRGIVFDAKGAPRHRFGGWYSREIWVEDLNPKMQPKDLWLTPADQLSTPPRSQLPTPIRSQSLLTSLTNSSSYSTQSQNERSATASDPIDRPLGDQLLEGSASDPGADRTSPVFATPPATTPDTEQSTFFSPRPVSSVQRVSWDRLVPTPNTRRVMWRPTPRLANASRFYEFSQLSMELNELSKDYDRSQGASMPATDSRYRPDQRLLEMGEIELSSQQKHRLEEKQRAAARLRPQGEAEYKPCWFEKGYDPIYKVDTWLFSNAYWKVKEDKKFDTFFNDIF